MKKSSLGMMHKQKKKMEAILDSSNEELTLEEKLLLSSKRQDPQGKEYEQDNDHSSSSSSLCAEQLDHPFTTKELMSSLNNHSHNMSLDSNSNSTYNTLIIHQNNNSLLADTWIPASHEFTSMGNVGNRGRGSLSSPDENYGQHSYNPAAETNKYISEEANKATTSEISEILSDLTGDYLDQLTVLKHLAKDLQDPSIGSKSQLLLQSSNFSKSQPDLTKAFNTNSQLPNQIVHIQGTSTNTKLTPPPYDLAKNANKIMQQVTMTNPSSSSIFNYHNSPDRKNQTDEVLPSVQMLEILIVENSNLKGELANARKKIQAINKIESELSRLQLSHESLFESAERREKLQRVKENLERTARDKLSKEVNRLTAVNRELLSSSNSLQNLSFPSADTDLSEYYRNEIAKKDIAMSQLISQNKELTGTKERQEIELSAQRATLAEQRNHINILEKLIATAQNNVVRLEDECQKKQELLDKLTQHYHNEKKLRSQLESEISDLKGKLNTFNLNNSHNSSTHQNPPNYNLMVNNNAIANKNNQNQLSKEATTELNALQDKLKLSEDKIQQLVSIVTKWEHYFKGMSDVSGVKSTPNNTGISTPNTPNSMSSRGGTPQHFFSGERSPATEETEIALHRANELQRKINDLESRLVEKDAFILLNHGGAGNLEGYNMNSNYNNSSVNSSSSYQAPPNYRESPSYSLAKGHSINYPSYDSPNNFYPKCESEPPPSYTNIPLKMRLGGSGSSLVKNSNESLHGSGMIVKGNSVGSVSGSSNASNTTRSIDEQLKDLDNQLDSQNKQLLSKGSSSTPSGVKMQSMGLCCLGIPNSGQSNQGVITRKEKLPKSILESLNYNQHQQPSYHLHHQPQNITEFRREPSSLKPNVNINYQPPTSSTYYKRDPESPSPGQSLLPPIHLPKPSNFTKCYQTTGIRTSSGPPFIQCIMNHHQLHTPPPFISSSSISQGNGGDRDRRGSDDKESQLINPGQLNLTSISSSADSILNSKMNSMSTAKLFPGGTKTTTLGLPPKNPNKCRSLERGERSNKNSNGTINMDNFIPAEGKYTSLSNYDKCKSLDRREMKEKSAEKSQHGPATKVSSKAALFGNFLSRASPCRDKTSSNSSGTKIKFANCDQDTPVDSDTAALLDIQGRSSQRSRRITKWTNLDSFQENNNNGVSNWFQRRNSSGWKNTENFSPLRELGGKVSFETGNNSNVGKSESSPVKFSLAEKKWGIILKKAKFSDF